MACVCLLLQAPCLMQVGPSGCEEPEQGGKDATVEVTCARMCAQLGVSEEVDARVRLLRERVSLESALQAGLVQLQGTLEPILHAALAQQPAALEE